MTDNEGRVLPAWRGAQWAREGVDVFAAAPAVWMGMTLLFVLIGVTLSVVPFAGLLWSVAAPILLGGVMLGCHAQQQGRPVEVRHLFAGFQAPVMQQLALVGALYLAATVLMFVLGVGVGFGGALGAAAVLGSGLVEAQPLVVVSLIALFVVVFMLIALLLSMSIWFAPALVALDGVPALDAMRISVKASLRNLPAFLVYGLLMLGIAVVILSPFIAAAVMIPIYGGADAAPAVVAVLIGCAVFALLCMLVAVPTVWGAMYASYRDVFHP